MSKTNETLNKAYGSIPKEINPVLFDTSWIPVVRPIKYFWLKWVVRKIFR